ncbi:membrane protein YczE [Saccharopolyspora tripterygii]
MASAPVHVDLSPLSMRVRPLARFPQLVGGLLLYGASLALMVRADLGLSPWSVLDQGISERFGVSMGVANALVGVALLLAWLPLRQPPGVGTVANVALIGIAVDATLALLSPVEGLALRVPLLVAGVVLNALATAIYVGARLGPGPRDGLMTGLHARTGGSVRLVRTSIEVCVLAVGWSLGGTAGLGTVLYAVAIGPLTQGGLRFTAVRVKKDLCP